MTGILVDVANDLFDRMNCTWEAIRAVDGTFGSRAVNGNWSGLIGMLKNKEIDMALSDLAVTVERSEVVDFAVGILKSKRNLYMKRPNQALSWTTFLAVFDHNFWIVLVAIVFSLSVIFFITYFFASVEDTADVGISLSTVLLAFVGLGITVNPRGLPGRILVLTVCLTGSIVWWAYNAGLVSHLTFDTINYPIGTLQHIADNKQFNVVIQKGTADEGYFLDASPNTDAYLIGKTVKEKKEELLVESLEEIEMKLLADPYLIYFGEEIAARHIFDSYPRQIAEVADEDYFKVSISFAFQKNSPYVPLANYILNGMLSSGTPSRFLNALENTKNHTGNEEDNFKAIKYENIFTAFLILLVGILAAILSLYVEKTSFIDFLIAKTGGMSKIFEPTRPITPRNNPLPKN